MLVDLKKKPYYLNDSQIKWVENTIEAMSLDEKLRQLFVALTSTTNKDELIDFAKKVKMGGVRYNPMSKEILYNHNKMKISNYYLLFCFNPHSNLLSNLYLDLLGLPSQISLYNVFKSYTADHIVSK